MILRSRKRRTPNIQRRKGAWRPRRFTRSTSNSESIETRSLPTLAHCFPRNFTFYVSHPIRSIREQAFNIGYGRGAGVGRGRGVGVCLPVGVGVGVAVAVGVGVGVGPDCAQYLPPVLNLVESLVPPQTIISLPLQIAV